MWATMVNLFVLHVDDMVHAAWVLQGATTTSLDAAWGCWPKAQGWDSL